MIQTQQLTPDTIVFQIQGNFHQAVARELALSVFRSHRLGFKTFLLDLKQVSLIDDEGSRQLALIEQGLRNKGGTWRMLNNHLSKHQIFSHENLEQFPKETWN